MLVQSRPSTSSQIYDRLGMIYFLLYSRWTKGEQFECPIQSFPYFFTKKNSDEFLRNTFSLQNDVKNYHRQHHVSNDVSHKSHNSVDDAAKRDNTAGGAEKHGLSGLTVGLIAAVSLMMLVVVVLLVAMVKARRMAHTRIAADNKPMTTYSAM